MSIQPFSGSVFIPTSTPKSEPEYPLFTYLTPSQQKAFNLRSEAMQELLSPSIELIVADPKSIEQTRLVLDIYCETQSLCIDNTLETFFQTLLNHQNNENLNDSLKKLFEVIIKGMGTVFFSCISPKKVKYYSYKELIDIIDVFYKINPPKGFHFPSTFPAYYTLNNLDKLKNELHSRFNQKSVITQPQLQNLIASEERNQQRDILSLFNDLIFSDCRLKLESFLISLPENHRLKMGIYEQFFKDLENSSFENLEKIKILKLITLLTTYYKGSIAAKITSQDLKEFLDNILGIKNLFGFELVDKFLAIPDLHQNPSYILINNIFKIIINLSNSFAEVYEELDKSVTDNTTLLMLYRELHKLNPPQIGEENIEDLESIKTNFKGLKLPLSDDEINTLFDHYQIIIEKYTQSKNLSVLELIQKGLQINQKSNSNQEEINELVAIAILVLQNHLSRSLHSLEILTVVDLLSFPNGKILLVDGEETRSVSLALYTSILALQKKRVHLIYTQVDQAKNNYEKFSPFFNSFSLHCSNICNKTVRPENFQEEKGLFSTDLIFGTAWDFQQAILSEFRYSFNLFPEPIKSEGTRFDVVLIDSVDNFKWNSFEFNHDASISYDREESLSWTYLSLYDFVKINYSPSKKITATDDLQPLRKSLSEFMGGIYTKHEKNLQDHQLIQLMREAHKALFQFKEGVEYAVQPYNPQKGDGKKIVIKDPKDPNKWLEYVWTGGLHEFLEMKHQIEVRTEQNDSAIKLSLPTFYQMYSSINCLTQYFLSEAKNREIQDYLKITFGQFSVPSIDSKRLDDNPRANEIRFTYLKEHQFRLATEFFTMLKNFHELRENEWILNQKATVLNDTLLKNKQSRDYSQLGYKSREIALGAFELLKKRGTKDEWKLILDQLILRVHQRMLDHFVSHYREPSEAMIVELNEFNLDDQKQKQVTQEINDLFLKKKIIWEKYLDSKGMGLIFYLEEITKIQLNHLFNVKGEWTRFLSPNLMNGPEPILHPQNYRSITLPPSKTSPPQDYSFGSNQSNPKRPDDASTKTAPTLVSTSHGHTLHASSNTTLNKNWNLSKTLSNEGKQKLTLIEPIAGFNNNGNDCFFNSISQLILHSSLSKHLLSEENNKPVNSNNNFRKFWQELALQYHYSASTSPTAAVTYPRNEMRTLLNFSQEHTHEDAHEAFCRIIGDYRMEKYMMKLKSTYLFDLNHSKKSEQKNTLYKVDKENKTYVKIDPVFSIDINIPKSNIESNFQDMIETSFTEQPELVENEELLFEHLGVTYETKKYRLQVKLTDIKEEIFFHLKRFDNQLQKISTSINIRMIHQFNDIPYRLRGYVTHIGESSKGGHYIACCLTPKGWKKFNDDSVIALNENQVLEEAKKAYILYFKKEDKPFPGFENKGNDDFFNSISQLILQSSLSKYFLNESIHLNEGKDIGVNSDNTFKDFWKKLALQYHSASASPNSTTVTYARDKMRTLLKFSVNPTYEDAHEALCRIIGSYRMEKYMMKLKSTYFFDLKDLKKSDQKNALYKVDKENKTYVKIDPVFSIDITIPRSNIESNFQDMIETFFTEQPKEVREETDLLFEYLGEIYETKKYHLKVELTDIKEEIFFHLKRFESQQQKISTSINIKMSHRFNGIPYRLKGYVKHIGGSIEEGKYMACCLTPKGWKKFNDDSVTALNENQVLEEAKKAYILYFKKEEATN